MAEGPELLLVGIDAACERVLEPLFDTGEIPTIEQLFSNGATGRLRSEVPPWTASAWPSLYTGTNPGKHGVFDFLAFDGYDWSVVDAGAVRTPPLWRLLDHHGLSSVVVNVPVTHPPGEFADALIPGYTAPEDPPCRPRGLLEAVRDATGPYRVYPDHTGERDPDRDRVVDELRRLAAMRGRAFGYLAERFDPAFGFVQFQGTDSVVHELPGDRQALAAVYRAVDRALAHVLDVCDPETVVVASDHGIGPYDGVEVRVNEVLRRAGLLSTTAGGRGMPTWARARDRSLTAGDPADGDDDPTPLARVTRGLAGLGVTSQRVARILEPLGLEERVAGFLPRDAVSAATEQVDFRNSLAYVRSRVECGVRLNVVGREPDGVVPPAEYEEVRSRVVALLAALETPNGEPVFETVAPREEFFTGPAVADAVDVVTVPASFDHLLSSQLRDEAFGDPREPWNHKRDGVLAVTGPAVEEGRELREATILDVAPTVLASLDRPVGEHMDGDPLPVVDAPGTAAYPGVDRDGDRSGGRTADTAERRLRDLGYLQ